MRFKVRSYMMAYISWKRLKAVATVPTYIRPSLEPETIDAEKRKFEDAQEVEVYENSNEIRMLGNINLKRAMRKINDERIRTQREIKRSLTFTGRLRSFFVTEGDFFEKKVDIFYSNLVRDREKIDSTIDKNIGFLARNLQNVYNVAQKQIEKFDLRNRDALLGVQNNDQRKRVLNSLFYDTEWVLEATLGLKNSKTGLNVRTACLDILDENIYLEQQFVQLAVDNYLVNSIVFIAALRYNWSNYSRLKSLLYAKKNWKQYESVAMEIIEKEANLKLETMKLQRQGDNFMKAYFRNFDDLQSLLKARANLLRAWQKKDTFDQEWQFNLKRSTDTLLTTIEAMQEQTKRLVDIDTALVRLNGEFEVLTKDVKRLTGITDEKSFAKGAIMSEIQILQQKIDNLISPEANNDMVDVSDENRELLRKYYGEMQELKALKTDLDVVGEEELEKQEQEAKEAKGKQDNERIWQKQKEEQRTLSPDQQQMLAEEAMKEQELMDSLPDYEESMDASQGSQTQIKEDEEEEGSIEKEEEGERSQLQIKEEEEEPQVKIKEEEEGPPPEAQPQPEIEPNNKAPAKPVEKAPPRRNLELQLNKVVEQGVERQRERQAEAQAKAQEELQLTPEEQEKRDVQELDLEKIVLEMEAMKKQIVEQRERVEQARTGLLDANRLQEEKNKLKALEESFDNKHKKYRRMLDRRADVFVEKQNLLSASFKSTETTATARKGLEVELKEAESEQKKTVQAINKLIEMKFILFASKADRRTFTGYEGLLEKAPTSTVLQGVENGEIDILRVPVRKDSDVEMAEAPELPSEPQSLQPLQQTEGEQSSKSPDTPEVTSGEEKKGTESDGQDDSKNEEMRDGARVGLDLIDFSDVFEDDNFWNFKFDSKKDFEKHLYELVIKGGMLGRSARLHNEAIKQINKRLSKVREKLTRIKQIVEQAKNIKDKDKLEKKLAAFDGLFKEKEYLEKLIGEIETGQGQYLAHINGLDKVTESLVSLLQNSRKGQDAQGDKVMTDAPPVNDTSKSAYPRRPGGGPGGPGGPPGPSGLQQNEANEDVEEVPNYPRKGRFLIGKLDGQSGKYVQLSMKQYNEFLKALEAIEEDQYNFKARLKELLQKIRERNYRTPVTLADLEVDGLSSLRPDHHEDILEQTKENLRQAKQLQELTKQLQREFEIEKKQMDAGVTVPLQVLDRQEATYNTKTRDREFDRADGSEGTRDDDDYASVSTQGDENQQDDLLMQTKFPLTDFAMIAIPGDGNCMYTAIARGMYKNPCSDKINMEAVIETGKVYKSIALKAIYDPDEKEYEYFAPLVVDDFKSMSEKEKLKAAQSYFAQKSPDSAYGSTNEAIIIAAQQLINVRFYQKHSTNDEQYYQLLDEAIPGSAEYLMNGKEDRKRAIKTVHLLHNGYGEDDLRSHFDLLVPVEDCKEETELDLEGVDNASILTL